MKKIWYLNTADALPGELGFDRSLQLVKKLSRQNNEIVWWHTSFSHAEKKSRKYHEIEQLFFKLELIPIVSYRNHSGVRRFLSMIAFSLIFGIRSLFMNKPDVIFVSGPIAFMTFIIFIYRYIYKCEIIIELRDLWPEGSVNMSKGLKKFLFRVLAQPLYFSRRILFLMGHKYIYLNKTFKDFAFNLYPSIKKKENLVAYPSPVINFSKIKKYKPRYIKSYGDIWGVFCGTFGVSHNQTIVIKALREFKNNSNMKIIFTGDGPHRKNIELLKEKWNLNNVIFTGYLDENEYLSILNQSDFGLSFYHPHSPVAFPTKIIDYIMADLPIIMSGSEEASKVIENNNAGLVIREEKVINVANAMKKFEMNEVYLRELTENIKSLKSLFDSEKQLNNMVEFINK